jgi:predicted TIM-barrel fold metal-dependent hydrolase
MDLWHIPVIDQHAHNLLNPAAASRYPYPAAFTEAHDAEMVNDHARQTLCYRRSVRAIAILLACEPTEEAILAQRTRLGLERLTALCYSAAKLDTVLLDDGFLPEAILPLEWHQRFVPVRRLLRLEMLAQKLLSQVEVFETFVERFRAELDPPPPAVVAFKSIAAYRTGLNIQSVSPAEAKSRFYALKQGAPEQSLRLADKPLLDFLLRQALEIAARRGIPVQLHTGLGDRDLDLRKANPLYLRSLLEEPCYQQVRLVLLHAAYPYVREASYLASVYSQVYLDFGLAIPLLSLSGMRETVRMLLELAPTSKLMYSSDAHFIPELYYLGAKWGREVLGYVLEQALQDADVTAREAEAIAAAVLRENARVLYWRSGREIESQQIPLPPLP